MKTSKRNSDEINGKLNSGIFVAAILLFLGVYGCSDNSSTGPDENPDPMEEFDFSGELIAFRSYRGGSDDIWLMTPDGSELINITNDPEGASDAAWSPDGSKIAFISLRTGEAELFIMNVDGSDVTQLTNNQGSIRWPRWSPDGSMIVYSANVNGQRDLYAMPVPAFASTQTKNAGYPSLATTCDEPVQLTDHPETDNEPVWSPDGSSIYFFSTRDGIGGVWEVDFGCDGEGKPIKLTVEFEFACAPGLGFSLVDGQAKLSLVGEEDDQLDIWTLDLPAANANPTKASKNPKSLNITKVTDDPAVDWASSWTGDGRLIFDTERSGSWDIYSIREDGTDMVALTSHSADDRYPAWRPQN